MYVCVLVFCMADICLSLTLKEEFDILTLKITFPVDNLTEMLYICRKCNKYGRCCFE